MQAVKARFSFTKIIVDDLDKAAAFYKDVFGMREYARIKDAVTPERPIEEIVLTLTDDLASGEPPLIFFKFLNESPPKGSDSILGLTVPDVDAIVERARQAGGKVVRQPMDMPAHGVRVAFVTDCDGRLIEIVQMLATS